MEITREDIHAAIVELLGSGFQTAIDAGGDIDSVTSQRELLRHSALVFLRNPDSLFYLASMYRDTLLETVTDFADSLTEAIDAVPELISDLQRPDTGPIDSAISSLNRLSSALSQGQHSPVSRSSAASFIQEYTDDVESRLLSGTSIRLSAAAAKGVIAQALAGLPTTISSILASVETILAADIEVATLEKIYLAVTIDRMLELMTEKKEAVTAAFDAEIKAFYTFLKASGNVLTVGDRYPTPNGPRLSGTGTPANTLANPAVTVEPAEVTGTKSVPIVVTAANKTFGVRFNGALSTVTLNESPPARVTGMKTGPFTIVTDSQATVTGTTSAPFNFVADSPWRVYVDGTYFEGTIALGNYANVAAMVAEITAKVSHPVEGGVAGYLAMTDAGLGELKLAYDHGGETTGDHRIILGSYTVANGILGFTDNQDSDDLLDPQVTQGVEGNDSIKLIVDAYAEQTAALTTGVRTATQVAADIDGAVTGVTSSDDGTGKLQSSSNTLGDGARVLVSGGSAPGVLGLYQSQLGASAHKRPGELLEDINDQISGGAATTILTTLSTGVCTTVVGVGNEKYIDLPAGEGANVAVDDVVVIQTGENAGVYTIAGITVDRITLDRNQRETAGPVYQKYNVIRQLIVLTSTKVDALDSSIQPMVASLFGFPVATVYGSVSDVEITGDLRYARPGDRLSMAADYTITAVSSPRVVVTPLISMNAGAAAATILSSDALSFQTMLDALEVWQRSFESAYPNFNALNVAVSKAVITPSAANRTAVANALNNLLDYFSGVGSLTEILEAFECRRLPIMDRLLATLEERGSLQGAKYLKSLDFSSFFDFDARLTYSMSAFDRLAELLKTHAPVEAVRETVDDELVEASDVPDIDVAEIEDDIDIPETSFLEIDEELEW